MRDISFKQNNMREISILKNRILQYIENKNISKYEFYQKTGISNGILSQKNGLSEDNILKFLSYFTDINPEWLLTGEGEMLLTKKIEVKNNDTNIIQIPIVSQYAFSDYSKNFDNTDFIKNLPTYPISVDRELKGYFIMFEVKGNSMDNNSKESLQEGDLLLSRNIKKEYWKYNLNANNWKYVIVHKTEGIMIRKIIKHDLEKKIITAHSLNPMFEDIDISLDEVDQLFHVIQIQRKIKD